MVWGLASSATRALRCALLAFFAGLLVVAGPVSARESFEAGSVCHLSGSKQLVAAEALARPDKWVCDSGDYDFKQQRHILRIDLGGKNKVSANPRYAEFDRWEFDRLSVMLVGEDGSTALREYDFDDTWLGASSLRSMVAIPHLNAAAQAVVFMVDGSQWPEVLAEAELVAEPSALARAARLGLEPRGTTGSQPEASHRPARGQPEASPRPA